MYKLLSNSSQSSLCFLGIFACISAEKHVFLPESWIISNYISSKNLGKPCYHMMTSYLKETGMLVKKFTTWAHPVSNLQKLGVLWQRS